MSSGEVICLTNREAFWGERTLHDAIKLIHTGKAVVVRADTSRLIHSGINRQGVVLKMPAPLVIKLVSFWGYIIKTEKIEWSKEAVFERDRNICQFVHRDAKGKRYQHVCTELDRTMDHLVPRSRGGKNTFINTVTSCVACNIKLKKNKTPLEAGMELIRLPGIPRSRKGDMAIISFAFNPNKKSHVAFQQYLAGIETD